MRPVDRGFVLFLPSSRWRWNRLNQRLNRRLTQGKPSPSQQFPVLRQHDVVNFSSMRLGHVPSTVRSPQKPLPTQLTLMRTIPTDHMQQGVQLGPKLLRPLRNPIATLRVHLLHQRFRRFLRLLHHLVVLVLPHHVLRRKLLPNQITLPLLLLIPATVQILHQHRHRVVLLGVFRLDGRRFVGGHLQLGLVPLGVAQVFVRAHDLLAERLPVVEACAAVLADCGRGAVKVFDLNRGALQNLRHDRIGSKRISAADRKQRQHIRSVHRLGQTKPADVVDVPRKAEHFQSLFKKTQRASCSWYW
uniref:(northern house mosquito) hypothetical protein n=1 Tax=Culex pipiens TaxID=7175 RepID=A0A8D8MC26_CULPI